MRLTSLLQSLQAPEIRGSVDLEVTDVCYHSKKVTNGSLFVAIPGFAADGRRFVSEAVAAGAKAVVFEGEFFDNLRATQIRVSGARLALAKLSATWFDHPTDDLTLAGVTGTNGKTTLTYLLEALWKAAGKKTGVVGTVNTRFGSTIWHSSQTTPESRDLQEIFSDMRKEKVTHAVMEASSHAICQGRIEKCSFDVCLFTNLTQDHLDFHKTMEEYYKSKEELFNTLVRSPKKNKLAIIGMEDAYGERLRDEVKEKLPFLTYGFGECDIHPVNYEIGLSGIQALVQAGKREISIESVLFGRFNLLNIMAAVGVGIHSGLTDRQIAEGIKNCRAVPGRLERIDDPKGGRLIFVDYAHTPDALKNVLEAIRKTAKGKIVTVFGCGGDRDKTKRPLMGFEAGRLSDVCVVTSDNPRTEEPGSIIGEILPGVEETGKKFLVEEDRKKGIAKALELAGRGDVVLIAGKGHEDYQIIGKTKNHFSDQETVREMVR